MQNLNGVLAKHDAEVIERFVEWFGQSGHVSAIEAAQDYAKQLRQQAKEVQS